MIERSGIKTMGALQKRWSQQSFLIRFFFAMTLACGTFVVCRSLLSIQLNWSLFITVAIFLLIWLKGYRKITTRDVARLYNQQFPEMEESAELFLKPSSDLNAIERLQLNKVESVLQNISTPEPLNKRFNLSLVTLIAVGVIGVGVLFFSPKKNTHDRNESSSDTKELTKEKVLPTVSKISLSITPPSYTRKQKRFQSQLNLDAEEDALLEWHINTSAVVDSLIFLINDTVRLSLHTASEDRLSWEGSMVLKRPGFYQLKVGDELSDLYKMELIKDRPPFIVIRSPQPYTEIELGRPKKVLLRAAVSDDYGISTAFISATVSSGSGEGIKFTERKISLGTNFSGADTSYSPERTIDLTGLGMQPGDELSFYINATDNRKQEGRSDIYRVLLPDTAELMNMEGLIKGVNLLPEYFRSQRQIIIETEQLLKDKSILTQGNFKDKSNNLGIDQKLLRLRYGKFLGEEFEANIGEHAGAEHPEDDHEKEAERNKAKREELDKSNEVLREFSHQHDNAEDANYFDAETKKQLRAVLAEMWNSELHLRTFKPGDALPYEYKALLLLKDLQQKSRVYVQKTAIKTTPVKEEKRLTGELNKIVSPVSQKNATQKSGTEDVLRKAAAILEELKNNPDSNAASKDILRQASAELRKHATEEPAKFLPALEAIRNIISANSKNQKASAADLSLTAKAISLLLPAQPALPFSEKTIEDMNLSDQYFRSLKKVKKQG